MRDLGAAPRSSPASGRPGLPPTANPAVPAVPVGYISAALGALGVGVGGGADGNVACRSPPPITRQRSSAWEARARAPVSAGQVTRRSDVPNFNSAGCSYRWNLVSFKLNLLPQGYPPPPTPSQINVFVYMILYLFCLFL